jgi:molecular chaperone GrpE
VFQLKFYLFFPFDAGIFFIVYYIYFMSEKNEKIQEEKGQSFEAKTTEENNDSKIKELEDKLLRSLAENENLRRRYEKEVKEAIEYGGINFAREILAVADNLNRAYEFVNQDENFKKNSEFKKILENIEVIKDDTQKIFEKNNIKQIECLNKKFDPNYHQAMLEVEDEKHDPGVVIQVLQAGYLMGSKLLRPALVAVSKKKPEKIEEKDEKK